MEKTEQQDENLILTVPKSVKKMQSLSRMNCGSVKQIHRSALKEKDTNIPESLQSIRYKNDQLATPKLFKLNTDKKSGMFKSFSQKRDLSSSSIGNDRYSNNYTNRYDSGVAT